MATKNQATVATGLFVAVCAFCALTDGVDAATKIPLESPFPAPLKEGSIGTLYRPNGSGPFPAVIVQHGCGGVNNEQDRAWAKRLTEWGYVALIVDSFTNRGLPKGQCEKFSDQVKNQQRASDAYAGLAYLRSQDFIIKEKIGLIGFSNGGNSVLEASNADARLSKWSAKEVGGPFAAAIAFYPECGMRYGTWDVLREDTYWTGRVINHVGKFVSLQPLLISIGELDDLTPAAPCQRLVEFARDGRLTIKVYPKAHHAFDTTWKVRYYPKTRNVNAKGRLGAHVGGNPRARKQAISDAKAFFDALLKQSKP
jgi:dienelactone hydrolase